MAEPSRVEIRKDFEQAEIHEQLESLAQELATRGRVFSVEGDFGEVCYDIYGDEIYPAGELAQSSIRVEVTTYEEQCWDAAVALTEAYAGGMKVEGHDVDLMLRNLDRLTVRRTDVIPAQVQYHPEEHRDDISELSRRFTRASWQPKLDSEYTKTRRASLHNQLLLTGDNPSNPRAVALAKVLENRWEL